VVAAEAGLHHDRWRPFADAFKVEGSVADSERSPDRPRIPRSICQESAGGDGEHGRDDEQAAADDLSPLTSRGMRERIDRLTSIPTDSPQV